ncbi:MAG TPA: hypothetical protein VNV15_08105 [Opitutaceae bacterium]|jgi:hypothetical protein|nr:hypothetical protein [Opitutaceae bacterium]
MTHLSLTSAFLFLAFLTLMLGVVYTMWLFDCLVRWEYDNHREQWERDGKPDGFFWRAKECVFWSSDLAKKKLGFWWMVKTPDWISESPKLRRQLFQMRIIFYIWNFSWILVVCHFRRAF